MGFTKHNMEVGGGEFTFDISEGAPLVSQHVCQPPTFSLKLRDEGFQAGNRKGP